MGLPPPEEKFLEIKPTKLTKPEVPDQGETMQDKLRRLSNVIEAVRIELRGHGFELTPEIIAAIEMQQK